MKNLVEINHLNFSYDGEKGILKDLSFQLKQGQVLGIIGPNGGGKSTLTQILTGQLPMQSGEYLLDGNPMSAQDYSKVACVPQRLAFNSPLPLTIGEYFDLEGPQKHKLDPFEREELLDLVGFQLDLNTMLRNLSGGQLQKVYLIKAMSCGPRLLVLDEPRSALDAAGQDQFLQLIHRIKKLPMAIIVVEHDLKAVLQTCDRVLCLNQTYHWHDKSELFSPKIMESIYHCELEHLQIHMETGAGTDHIHCSHNHDADNHQHDFPQQGTNEETNRDQDTSKTEDC
jgi:zinc transport system ATP-binding protein